MKKLFTSLVLLLALEQVASATFFSFFTEPESSITHTPLNNETDVAPDVVITLSYGEKIDQTLLSTNNVVLTKLSGTTEKIDGTVAYTEEDKTIKFIPTTPLEGGQYEVVYKDILKVDSSFFFFMKWITIETVSFKFEVSSKQLVSLETDTTNIELNEKNTTTINVLAQYSDNTVEDVTSDVEWIMSAPSIVTIDKNLITPTKEGKTTLHAKFNGQITQEISVTVYKEINGYRLPPPPDKLLNDSTLLGIDLNNNYVRDDVERWIYENYTEPVEIGLFMQNARVYQIAIEDPSRANETVLYSDAALACEFYWIGEEAKDKESFTLDEYKSTKVDRQIKSLMFNNIQRHIAYERYNGEFNGKTLHAPEASKEKCNFDENGLLGESL